MSSKTISAHFGTPLLLLILICCVRSVWMLENENEQIPSEPAPQTHHVARRFRNKVSNSYNSVRRRQAIFSSTPDPSATLERVAVHGNPTSAPGNHVPARTPFVMRLCNQKDSAGLNKCLQQVLKDLKPRLAHGIPEVSLPPMDPLLVHNISFQHGAGAIKVAASFGNVRISGLSNFTRSDFWVDVPKKTLDFDMIFPQLSLAGVYELNGNLFFIPVGGSGNFYLNLDGVRTRGASKLAVFRNATRAHVVVTKTEVNLDIADIKVHLTNLFNGDPTLGSFVNNFLNENSLEVFEELKPQIRLQIGQMTSLLANRALASLSAKQFDDLPFTDSYPV